MCISGADICVYHLDGKQQQEQQNQIPAGWRWAQRCSELLWMKPPVLELRGDGGALGKLHMWLLGLLKDYF